MSTTGSKSKQVSVLKLLGRYVQFYPKLADITGSVNSALMLSQALYWTEHSSDPDGWFYKSREEWYAETRLGRREQETARLKLRETGFWEEKECGRPCRLHFRVNEDALDMVVLASGLGGKRPTAVGRKAPNLRAESAQLLHAQYRTNSFRPAGGHGDGAMIPTPAKETIPHELSKGNGRPAGGGLIARSGDPPPNPPPASDLPSDWTDDKLKTLKRRTTSSASRVIEKERAMLARFAGRLTLADIERRVLFSAQKMVAKGMRAETLCVFEQDLEDEVASLLGEAESRPEPERTYRYCLDDAQARHDRKRGITLEMVIEQGGAMTTDEARQAFKAGRVSREDFPPRKETRR